MLSFIYQYQWLLIAMLLLVLLILTILLIKDRRIKPIDLEQIEEVKEEKTSIEQMLEAMENKVEERPVTTFEQEQEANAIISYQELVQAVKAKKAREEYKPNEELVETILEEVQLEDEQPKFKSSEFISPVFGKDSNKDEFLKELKDFRKKL